MFAPPIAPQSSSLASLHQLGLPPSMGSSTFMPALPLPFGSQDLARAHQELNERFLRDRAAFSLLGSQPGPSPLPGPYAGLYADLHQQQQQQQQQQLSQHLASAMRPPLGAAAQLSWLFDKLPKFDVSPLGRQQQPSGLPSPFSGLPPMYPPIGPIGSGLSGAFQPKNGVSVMPPSPLHALPLPEREKLPSLTKRTGRWCAAHVRIAWQIHLHLQKQQQASPDDATNTSSTKPPLSSDTGHPSSLPQSQATESLLFASGSSLRSPFDMPPSASAGFLPSAPPGAGPSPLQRLPLGLNNPLLPPRSPFNMGPFGLGAFLGGNLPGALFGMRDTAAAQDWVRFMRQAQGGAQRQSLPPSDSDRLREKDTELRRRGSDDMLRRDRDKERDRDRTRDSRESKGMTSPRRASSPDRVESSSGRSRSRSPLRGNSSSSLLAGEAAAAHRRHSTSQSETDGDAGVDSGRRSEPTSHDGSGTSRDGTMMDAISPLGGGGLAGYWSAAMNLSRIELQQQMERQRSEVLKRMAQYTRDDVDAAARMAAALSQSSALAANPSKRLGVTDAPINYGKPSSPRSPFSNSQSPDSSSKDKLLSVDSESPQKQS